MGGYDHVLSKYDLYLTFPVREMKNIWLCSHFANNLESAELTIKNHEKLTLDSLIAYHVLEMSVKLKFQCVRFRKKHFFKIRFESVFTRC